MSVLTCVTPVARETLVTAPAVKRAGGDVKRVHGNLAGGLIGDEDHAIQRIEGNDEWPSTGYGDRPTNDRKDTVGAGASEAYQKGLQRLGGTVDGDKVLAAAIDGTRSPVAGKCWRLGRREKRTSIEISGERLDAVCTAGTECKQEVTLWIGGKVGGASEGTDCASRAGNGGGSKGVLNDRAGGHIERISKSVGW